MEMEEAVPEGGEADRIVATAYHIVKSLGTSEIMTKDMLTILSTFDNRLSAMSNENPGNPPRKSIDFEANLASAERIISSWDTSSSKAMLFQSSRKEAFEYLAAVDSLRQLMENPIVARSSSAKLVRAQRLMEMSMARLQKEFQRILSANVEPILAPPDDDSLSHGSSDDDWTDEDGSSDGRRPTRNSNPADEICEIDMIPLDAVLDLRSIAKRIVAGGYGSECVRIYGLARKSVIKGCLNRIGVERISTSDLQKMEWGFLESKIKNWIRTVKIAVRILFASEKRLCDEIFAGLNNVRDSCFTEVVKGPTRKLLAFGESVAMSKKSSERIFRVLDMYETLSDLLPDIEIVYSQESCLSVRTQASTIFVRLGESARGILTEFENAIRAENSKTPVPGGTIHPLTRYVMNYLSFLCDYKETLMKIIANTPIDIPKALPDGDLDGHDEELGSTASALSVKMRWIIKNLQSNLDLKSKLYKDASLSHLFLTNNLHYIVKKVKESELLGLLGHGWLTKNEGMVRQYAANYEQVAWMKVLNYLRDEEINVNEGCSNEVSQQALKDRFKGFNLAIEEVFRNHSAWMVPDMQLQEELRHSIAEKMIPDYRSFLARFSSGLERGRDSEMYMKYTPEDLEVHLLDLFKATHRP